jgi:isopentenyl-diphosphate delta-isomerase
MEQVILVDKDDNRIGVREKLDAHRNGELHRAFSVFVFNAQGALLIQQRAESKYHTSGMWTNTCDGHPRPGEETLSAARRRLLEEMGFDCELAEAFAITYQADLGDDLVEHEYDHVLVGWFDGEPAPDPDEASDWKWIDMETLAQDMQAQPDSYAPWFRIAQPGVLSYLGKAS